MDFTPVTNISNGQPLLINELNGAPPIEASHISNLNPFKARLQQERDKKMQTNAMFARLHPDKVMSMEQPGQPEKSTESVESFADVCEKYIPYMRHIALPAIDNQSRNQTVLIDSGCSMHLEFVIRNVITKLGEGWGHNVICSPQNVEFMTHLCQSISPDICVEMMKTVNTKVIVNADKYVFYNGYSCMFAPENGNVLVVSNEQLAEKSVVDSIRGLEEFADKWPDFETWRAKLFASVVVKFKEAHFIKNLQFRGGWGSVLEGLLATEFFQNDSSYVFYDIIEQHFTQQSTLLCREKWTGVIHLTQNTPPFWESQNIQGMFKNEGFIQSLDLCPVLFVLSNYVAKYVKERLLEMGKNIPIVVLKHPVVQGEDIPKFDLAKYRANPQKKLLQIGQQLRKMTSIYRICPSGFERRWLTGTRDFKRLYQLFDQEKKHFKLGRLNPRSIRMHYTETFAEYDDLLSQNIVFVDLFDASANNTVLECIVRRTPIIVNRLEGVVEYLGEDYPLYFSELSEVEGLLTAENIEKAVEYLNRISTADLEIVYFNQQIRAGIARYFG